MMTRLIVNLTQVYIPLYVTDSLFLDKVCKKLNNLKIVDSHSSFYMLNHNIG